MGETTEMFEDNPIAAIHSLAQECGAHRVFFTEARARAFGVFWLKELLRVAKPTAGSRSNHPKEALRWMAEIEAANVDQIKDVCARIRCDISQLDDDDEWSTDECLGVISAVCIAADIGFQNKIRWLAEAATATWRFSTGCHNYNSTIAVSMHHWMRHQFERCVARFEDVQRITELEAEVARLKKIEDAMRHPPSPESIERRLEAIEKPLGDPK